MFELEKLSDFEGATSNLYIDIRRFFILVSSDPPNRTGVQERHCMPK
jgi:hypothetical protein